MREATDETRLPDNSPSFWFSPLIATGVDLVESGGYRGLGLSWRQPSIYRHGPPTIGSSFVCVGLSEYPFVSVDLPRKAVS